MAILKDSSSLKELRSKMVSIKESAALIFQIKTDVLGNFQKKFSLDASLVQNILFGFIIDLFLISYISLGNI